LSLLVNKHIIIINKLKKSNFRCLTCSNNTLNDCLSCEGSDFRTKDTVSGIGKCQCNDGYYDDGSS
jgi:hypothetical protein